MIKTYAILSTLALDLPMTYKNLKSFCGENNISYDVTIHLGRTFSIINFQSINLEEHNTKYSADLYQKAYTVKQSKYESVGKLPICSVIS